MKDEALSPTAARMDTLPVPDPPANSSSNIQSLVDELTGLIVQDRDAQKVALDSLRLQFEIADPGQKLRSIGQLDEDAFIKEVRKRRPRTTPPLTPVELRAVQELFRATGVPIKTRRTRVLMIERSLSDLVEQAYALTDDERRLMWRTAPPRMPFLPPLTSL